MTKEDFKSWRLKMGWSQEEAARRLGYKSGAVQISRLENGTYRINGQVELACKYFLEKKEA